MATNATLPQAQPPKTTREPWPTRKSRLPIQNATSHSLRLDPKAMRLLDDRGRKVVGRVRVSGSDLPAHGTTTLSATWKSGNPVRIDYGTGTLALPSG